MIMNESRLEKEVIQKALKEGREVNIKPYGGSMLPVIWEGEIIKVVACDVNSIKPRTIILYWEESKEILIAHRFWKRIDDKLLTKGDASLSRKGFMKVKPENVIGQVNQVIKKWGHLNFDWLPMRIWSLIFCYISMIYGTTVHILFRKNAFFYNKAVALFRKCASLSLRMIYYKQELGRKLGLWGRKVIP